jgi:hypothetical protein
MPIAQRTGKISRLKNVDRRIIRRSRLGGAARMSRPTTSPEPGARRRQPTAIEQTAQDNPSPADSLVTALTAGLDMSALIEASRLGRQPRGGTSGCGHSALLTEEAPLARSLVLAYLRRRLENRIAVPEVTA